MSKTTKLYSTLQHERHKKGRLTFMDNVSFDYVRNGAYRNGHVQFWIGDVIECRVGYHDAYDVTVWPHDGTTAAPRLNGASSLQHGLFTL